MRVELQGLRQTAVDGPETRPVSWHRLRRQSRLLARQRSPPQEEVACRSELPDLVVEEHRSQPAAQRSGLLTHASAFRRLGQAKAAERVRLAFARAGSITFVLTFPAVVAIVLTVFGDAFFLLPPLFSLPPRRFPSGLSAALQKRDPFRLRPVERSRRSEDKGWLVRWSTKNGLGGA